MDQVNQEKEVYTAEESKTCADDFVITSRTLPMIKDIYQTFLGAARSLRLKQNQTTWQEGEIG